MASQSPWSAISAAKHLLGISGTQFTDAQLNASYKAAAKEAHPDAGGSNEAMAQVNLAREVLAQLTVDHKERTNTGLGDALAYIEQMIEKVDSGAWSPRAPQEPAAVPKRQRVTRKPKAKAKPATVKVTLQVSSTGVLTNPEGVVLGRFSDSAAAAGYCVNTGWDYALEVADG